MPSVATPLGAGSVRDPARGSGWPGSRL